MPATNVLAMVVVHSSCLYLQQLKQPLPPSLPVAVDELCALACLVRLFEFMVRHAGVLFHTNMDKKL
jgi:hypothetical protein